MMRAAIILLTVLVGIPLLASHLVQPRWISLLTLILVGLMARTSLVNAPTASLLARWRTPSRPALRWTTFLVGACSVCYLLATAIYQHRDLIPRLHDEHCYIIQSRMLAIGRLWEPQHPLADFFDNFYMLSRPVYAPIYFPGTALLNMPFVSIGAPSWTMPVLVTGATIAMTYYLVTVLVDGVAGLIAAVVAISTWGLREFSTIVMSQAPMTLLGLLIVWAWLTWRKEHRLWRAAILGLCIGWAAITRPVDMIAFAAPVGIAMIFDMREMVWRRRVHTLAAVLCGIIPFVALQAVFNHGTTGRAWVSPYTTYLKEDQPGSSYGFHAVNLDARPTSVLPQKRQYFEQFRLREIKEHTLSRLPYESLRRTWWTLYSTVPAGILVLLLPAAIVGLTDRRRWVLGSSLPLFVGLYLGNPFFLVHYAVPFVPVIAFSIALAVHVLSKGGRDRPPNGVTSAFLTLIVLSVCISTLPEFRRDVRDGTVPAMPLMALTHRELSSVVNAPAVVLFRYTAADNPVEEPAYNDDVVWPDQATVIRANDLGPRNIEIARYYAARQPWRKFYLLDRQENVGRQHLLIHFLGDAGQFAHSLESASQPDVAVSGQAGAGR